jgi:hypothetical protein
MDAVVWAMDNYQEHLQGRKFILYIDHKPQKTLGTLHTKTLNRLLLAMMDFDFKIRYKKGSMMPGDFLLRSFIEIGAISVLDVNCVHAQSKETFQTGSRKALI